MDNLRTFFIFGLLIVGLMLWQAWQKDYVQPQQVAEQKAVQKTENNTSPGEVKNSQDLPDIPTAQSAEQSAKQTASKSEKIHIKTDVMDIELDTVGGDIRKLDLLKYAVDSKHPHTPVEFMDDKAGSFFVTQSGLRSAKAAPTHYDQYTAQASQYTLADGQDTLQVPLTWQGSDGIQVVKTYTFHRGSYLVDVDYKIKNNSGDVFTAYPYAQFNREKPDGKKGSKFVHTYTGAVFSSEGHEYDKVKFDKLDEAAFHRDAKGGWAAMLQHYFVAALIPQPTAKDTFYGKAVGNGNYIAGVRLPEVSVAPGSQADAKYQMYIGPKEHDRLQHAAKKLDLTVDYGALTIISDPLFKILSWIHKYVGNWGWSIVLMTMIIKLAFYKLSATSYRSMAAMRKLSPKLAQMKERYGDDKQKFNQEMMKLYRTEKINPLGGCLPILVQMPVFLAYYWVLVESIELRQAPFILWIHDLTAMDPYFILPVLFGISMFIQQKLNPAPQDPAQAMMMKVLPIVFTVFFAFFPSGLVLYWVVNNTLSIAQQWYITRKLDAL